MMHSGCPYFPHLPQEKQQQEVLESEEETAIFEFVHVWLEKLLDHLWGGSRSGGGEGCGEAQSVPFAAYMRAAIQQVCGLKLLVCEA